VKHTKKK